MVGGPSEVYAMWLCGMGPQGQGGWCIAYFADNFQIFCDFLGNFKKKVYFNGK